jgi:hypothetical protein
VIEIFSVPSVSLKLKYVVDNPTIEVDKSTVWETPVSAVNSMESFKFSKIEDEERFCTPEKTIKNTVKEIRIFIF